MTRTPACMEGNVHWMKEVHWNVTALEDMLVSDVNMVSVTLVRNLHKQKRRSTLKEVKHFLGELETVWYVCCCKILYMNTDCIFNICKGPWSMDLKNIFTEAEQLLLILCTYNSHVSVFWWYQVKHKSVKLCGPYIMITHTQSSVHNLYSNH